MLTLVAVFALPADAMFGFGGKKEVPVKEIIKKLKEKFPDAKGKKIDAILDNIQQNHKDVIESQTRIHKLDMDLLKRERTSSIKALKKQLTLKHEKAIEKAIEQLKQKHKKLYTPSAPLRPCRCNVVPKLVLRLWKTNL